MRNQAMRKAFADVYGGAPEKFKNLLSDLIGVLDTCNGLAELFHTRYEELAPNFGYETKEGTRKAWNDIPEDDPNKLLMIATCMAVITDLRLQDEVCIAVNQLHNEPWRRCDHDWKSFENEVVEGGLICVKCKSFKGVGQDDRELFHVPTLKLKTEFDKGATPPDPKYFVWIKECGDLMGKNTEDTADLVEDPNWFGCYDDGMKPVDAVREYYKNHPRYAGDVIEKILEIENLPDEFRAALEDLKERAPYVPPEQHQGLWNRFAAVVNEKATYPPKEPWELTVFKIMTLEDYKEPTDAEAQ